MKTEAIYGSWKSPLSSQIACDSSISIKRLYTDSHNPDIIFWSELHPKENGRTLVFSKNINDSTNEVTKWINDGYSAHTTVHEYGGASFFVHNGTLYFMNNSDFRIYSQASSTSQPVAITHGPIDAEHGPLYRYADADFSKQPNFFFCIREDHSGDVKQPKVESVNSIISVNVKTGDETDVVSGNDFYASPRVSPDGKKLCWMTWNHPNMPWDETEIWVGDIEVNGDKMNVLNPVKVASQEKVNFMEPSWNFNNELLFISDATGWWNLYVVEDLTSLKARNVYNIEKEIGSPFWQFGHRSYAPHPKNKNLITVLYGHKPSLLNTANGHSKPFNVSEDSYVISCAIVPVDGAHTFFHVVEPTQPAYIMKCHQDKLDIFHRSSQLVVDSAYISKPIFQTFPTGDDGKQVAYGHYYPPKNPDFEAPEGTLPPLLIKIHGGPTGCASLALDLGKQYYTSRGFAILDVDYRGSTSYGTAFRNALKGNWGVYDIEDTTAGGLYMANQKLADVNKIVSSGGSAGGYTTLADLTFKSEHFAAGASHYGISDLTLLAAETHKFESRYCDTMIGKYPEDEELYKARSPLYHKEKFKTPCVFFQGALDKVCPPNQSLELFKVIRDEHRLPCSYVEFPDEAHGFRKANNKQKALDGELYFFSRVLEFEPADKDIEIPIENLDKLTKMKK